jgi:hypothetical protein
MNFTHDENTYLHLDAGDTDEEGRVFIRPTNDKEEALAKLQEIASQEFGVKIVETEKGWTWLDEEVKGPAVVITATAGKKKIRMFTCTETGGLRELGTGAQLLKPWEFSVAKYAEPSQAAAAREYVRRKLKKLSGAQ